MIKQVGFTHLVVMILISIMAMGLVGVAWYYEEHKIETNTQTTQLSAAVSLNTSQTITQSGVDEHGCNLDQDYFWCELSLTCINNSVEECDYPTTSNNQTDKATTQEEVRLEIGSADATPSESITYLDDSNVPDDWGTHTNSTYNYSIKYPPSWTVKISHGGDHFVSLVPPGVPTPDKNSEIEYLSRWVNINVATEIDHSEETVLEKEAIVVNNNLGSKSVNLYLERPRRRVIRFEDKKYIYELQWDERHEKDYSEYEKILSSFKFENELATYVNREYSFTLTYPKNDWTISEETMDVKPLFSLTQNTDTTQFIKIYPLGKTPRKYGIYHDVDMSSLGGSTTTRKLYYDQYIDGRPLYTICQYFRSSGFPKSWTPMGAYPDGGLSFEASCNESDELKDILATFAFLE